MSSTTLPIAKAITAGLRDAMRADDRVMMMGEDIGVLGGVFRVTDGLHAEFGDLRVVDTPLAEAGIVGTAVGLAVRGYRPVVEIQFDGFVFPAYSQITTQLAKMHYRTQGRVRMPRSEEHTSELQSRGHLVCRLLLEKKKYFLIRML